MKSPALLLIALVACDPAPRSPSQAPPPLTLTSPPLVRNTIAHIGVQGATPHEEVFLVATPDPSAPGACVPSQPGVCLDIGQPLRLLGRASADAAGEATFAVPLRGAGPPQPVAMQAVQRMGPELSPRLDATLVDSDPASAHLDACDLDDSNATRLPAVELYGPNRPGPFFPGFSSFGLGGVVIDNDVDYQIFQADNGMSLPPVDFSRRTVLATVYSASSTCGVDIEEWRVHAHPDTLEAVLAVDVRDSSANCPFACAAVGMTAVVVSVPRTPDPTVCPTIVGGCP